MAFLDNVKKKVTSTSQTAVQKTKDLTTVTRLNAQISEAENKINDLYYKLGFEIYRTYREEPLEAGAEQIAQISELHQAITDYKAQIASINQANLCPNCGAKVSKGMAFCSSCGFKLPTEEAKKPMVCSKCGAEISENDVFCTACGNNLTEQA